MEIGKRRVLILGGSGLVGMAVARELMPYEPAALIVCGLEKEDAENAVAELEQDPARKRKTKVEAEWGDVFLLDGMKETSRADVLSQNELRARLVDDIYGELNEDVFRRSALGSLLLRRKPDILIDCINTATAFAYQDIFDGAAKLRAEAAQTGASLESVERLLATLYMPQLIRHTQITLEGMRRAGTAFYVKVGTSGTGGMGLNIPFTHSEERPSRMLLSKAGIAGAHTLLLYLMARTPGAPAVKEIKPTAAISWKRIAFGEVRRRGRPIEAHDASRSVPVDDAFELTDPPYAPTGQTLRGVWLDAGENGLFSLGEFETLTSLGLMEFVTPEEVAQDVVREILGRPTGHDVVAALDAATSGPTYRAGVMRQVALERMAALEAEHGVEAVAYEMLGPPRLSKLLFESTILSWLYDDLTGAAVLDPDDAAERAEALIRENTDLRIRMLSIGLPILLADGQRMLRGPEVKVSPEPGQSARDPKLADNGWVDLRPANWRKWSVRVRAMLEAAEGPGPDHGSRRDHEPDAGNTRIRPGRMAAWVFREEDRGARVKR